MRNFIVILLLTVTFFSEGICQDLPYEEYKKKLILYPSLGFKTAPFSLSSTFGNDIKKLRYRPNLNAVLGFGFNYKFLSFSAGIKLPGYLRSTEKYGKTQYFDIGTSFPFKSWYFNLNLNNYTGYAIKNASDLHPDLGGINTKNEIKALSGNLTINIAAWKFFNPDFKAKPASGIAGRYSEMSYSFYVKPVISLHGVYDGGGILPYNYLDTTNSIYRVTAISAFDFGAIPGFAFVDNINGWQYGGWAGIGGVIQTKVYTIPGLQRKFIGLAPRIDVNLRAGYNVKDWFVMLNASYDNRQIRFQDLRYNHSHYTISIVGGYRFKVKERLKFDKFKKNKVD